ncbi:ANTAR domain-containing response regulator [Geodermatophilus sp. SYSU D00705]
MTVELEQRTRPAATWHAEHDVQGWARVRREMARAQRQQAEQMRARAAGWRLAAGARHPVVSDPTELHRRVTEAESRVAHLQIALTSNRRIGMAIGILMARHRLTEDQAFDLLRKQSSRRNVKLVRLAEEVVYTGSLEVPSPSSATPPVTRSPDRPAAARQRPRTAGG